MSLTGKDIAEISKLLDDSNFNELRLEMGEFKLRISRGGASRAMADFEPDEGDTPALASAAAAPRPAASAVAASAGEQDVPAPLLGNFYHAARPGEEPFVKVGDRVEADSAIGIIEVMKLMNSVRAGVAGTVTAMLAPDGQAVEEGQPLIRVKVGG